MNPKRTLSIETTGVPLSRLLVGAGIFPDLRCGGNGRCGRCKVKVLSGIWEENGRRVTAPAELLACRSKLLAGPGLVEWMEKDERVQTEIPPIPRAPYPEFSTAVAGIDLGTTTVAGALLHHGKIIRCAATANAQRAFGDNVIDRITAARREKDALQAAAFFSIGKILEALAPPENALVTIAGNTVMLALLCGADPESLGHAPFAMPEMNLAGFSLPKTTWKGDVLILPPLSAYLGGDVTAGWKEIPLAPGEMLADIGTNCEILYHSPTMGMIGTSTAAGPAFEGSGIGCGSRVRPGVVCHIVAPKLPQICGNAPISGISGTGFADLLFWARKLDQIDRFGKCRSGNSLEVFPGITLSDEEIAALLTAKAAIYAGITALERYAGAPAKTVYLAGEFAAHLSLEHAVAIGMLPAGKKYVQLGNMALSGALRAGCGALAGEPVLPPGPLPREIRPDELPDFAELFAQAMLLP